MSDNLPFNDLSHASQPPLRAWPPGDEPHEPVVWSKPIEVTPPRLVSTRLIWLVAIIGTFFVMRFVMPRIVEEVQYALTRGEQRAQYELAEGELTKLPVEELSRVSQLVSQRVAPSVVHINTITNQDLIAGDALDVLGGMPQEPSGQGSGVIVDSDGYIVTNAHVVFGSEDIQVKLSDGRRVRAQMIGVDQLTDLAVLKIEADRLIAASWGDSNQLEVGSLVWAVGSPFGLDHSITFGILSAKDRGGIAGITYHQDFLQTDAAVNPGNSGGPLVDGKGRVVGINTAIVGQVYQGISFAIPSNVARHVYQRLKTNGRVVRGWFGVQPESVTYEMASQLGLAEPRGAYVAKVVTDQPSPAMLAGVQEKDVLLSWNGEPIDGPHTLFSLVGMTEVGSTAEVVVLREGREMTLKVDVAARPVE